MDAEQILQRAGLDSSLSDARDKARQTVIDVQTLEEWLNECNEMDTQ